MTDQSTIDIVKDHFVALHAGDARVREVRVLRNNENPTPPKKEADIDAKVTCYLRFPPAKEEARAIGEDVPWNEIGAFQVHYLAAANSGPAADLATEMAKTAKHSLRNKSLADKVDIHDFLAGRPGESWGGNFWGESFSVEYETQNV